MKLGMILCFSWLISCVGYVDGIFEIKFEGTLSRKIESGILFADINPMNKDRISETLFIGVDSIYNDSRIKFSIKKRYSCSDGVFSDKCTSKNLKETDSLYLLLQEDQKFTILPTIGNDSLIKIDDFAYWIPTIMID